jgi:nucleoside-diphosphate-sugar epimerase
MPENKLIPTLVKYGKMRKLPALGNPDATYDYIHVHDVCRALCLAASRLTPDWYGGAINIGTGMATAVRGVVDLARAVMGIPEEPRWGSYHSGVISDEPWRAQTLEAEELINFKSEIKLEDGFREYAGG